MDSLSKNDVGYVTPREVKEMWERAGHTSIHGMPSPDEVELLVSAFVVLTEKDKNSWCTSYPWYEIIEKAELFSRAGGLRIKDEAEKWLMFLSDTGLIHKQTRGGREEICFTRPLVEKAVEAAIAMLPNRNQT